MKENGRDGIIVGVSSLTQLESNLRDIQKGPLPEEVVEALDKAWLITKPTAPDYWHLDLKYTYNTKQVLFGPKSIA
jgi:aflatoxin B1 aldehyde reductase